MIPRICSKECACKRGDSYLLVALLHKISPCTNLQKFERCSLDLKVRLCKMMIFAPKDACFEIRLYWLLTLISRVPSHSLLWSRCAFSFLRVSASPTSIRSSSSLSCRHHAPFEATAAVQHRQHKVSTRDRAVCPCIPHVWY